MKFKILIGASIIISTSFCTNSDSGKKKNQNITKLLILNSVLTGSKPAIVFSATDGVGKSGIYTMGSDGSSLKRITNSTYGDSFPVWSPDGSKIVFVRLSSDSTSNIYLMNADGSGVVQVTKGTGYDSSPVWSPDGTKIAFQRKTSSSSSGSVIYTILTDGTSETSITGSTSTTAAGPKWSPDGSKLAYTSTTSTIALVTKKSDGTGSHSSVDTTSLYYPGYTWSSDGTKLIYSQYDTVTFNFDIKAKNADGTGSSSFLTSNNKNEDYPVVSPDGKKIVYTRAYSSSGFTSLYTIYTMNSDGSSQTDASKNTSSTSSHDNPVWSPDSSSIIFTSGRISIYSMSADGSSQKKLTGSSVLESITLGGWTK